MKENNFCSNQLEALRDPLTLERLKEHVNENDKYFPKNFEDLDDETINKYFVKIINTLKEKDFLKILCYDHHLIILLNLIAFYEKFHYMMLELKIINVLGLILLIKL
jgi:hypothetical protein